MELILLEHATVLCLPSRKIASYLFRSRKPDASYSSELTEIVFHLVLVESMRYMADVNNTSLPFALWKIPCLLFYYFPVLRNIFQFPDPFLLYQFGMVAFFL